MEENELIIKQQDEKNDTNKIFKQSISNKEMQKLQEFIQQKMKSGNFKKAFQKYIIIIFDGNFICQQLEFQISHFKGFFFCLQKILLRYFIRKNQYKRLSLNLNLFNSFEISAQILYEWIYLLSSKIYKSPFLKVGEDLFSQIENKVNAENFINTFKNDYNEFNYHFLSVMYQKLIYERKLKNYKSIALLIKQYEKISHFYLNIKNSDIRVIEYLSNIQIMIANYYFELQDFNQALQNYNLAFDLIQAEIMKKQLLFIQQNPQKKDKLLRRQKILSEALYKIIIVLVNMEQVTEYLGDFQKSFECIKLLHWFRLYFGHVIQDCFEIDIIISKISDEFNDQFSNQLKEEFEIRRILNHIINLQYPEHENKPENEEIEQEVINYNEHLYYKYNYDQINSAQYIVQREKQQVINKVVEQDVVLQHKSSRRNLHSKQFSNVTQFTKFSMTDVSSTKQETIQKDQNFLDVKSYKKSDLKLSTFLTVPTQESIDMTDTQTRKSFQKQKRTLNLTQSNSYSDQKNFKPKLVTSSKYWDYQKYIKSIPQTHLSMLQPKICKRNKLQEKIDQKEQQKSKQGYIEQDDYYKKLIYNLLDQQNKNKSSLPFDFVCDGVKQIQEDQQLMNKEIKNSIKQLFFKSQYCIQSKKSSTTLKQSFQQINQFQQKEQFIQDEQFVKNKIEDAKNFKQTIKRQIKKEKPDTNYYLPKYLKINYQESTDRIDGDFRLTSNETVFKNIKEAEEKLVQSVAALKHQHQKQFFEHPNIQQKKQTNTKSRNDFYMEMSRSINNINKEKIKEEHNRLIKSQLSFPQVSKENIDIFLQQRI